jgi:hypothetical protein
MDSNEWSCFGLGIGGETGWGVMGESIDKAVTTITELIESNLMKLAEQRAKAEAQAQAERAAANADVSKATTSGRSGATALRADDSVIRPSMMLAANGDDAENSDRGSDSMEEID